MKVLHIANWYPNRENDREALFIKRQIETLEEHVEDQVIIHLQVKTGRFKIQSYHAFGAKHVVWQIPTSRWFIIELISTMLLFLVLLRQKANRYDILNFHIAYPNLTYWHYLKKVFRTHAIITEHWSAYHFHFNVDRALPRIQRIFKQDIPLIAVSQSLATDVKIFSQSEFPIYIVPNVVKPNFEIDTSVVRNQGQFFMVAQWKYPKQPLIVIDAFKRLVDTHSTCRLIIAGYGPQWEDIEKATEGIEQISLLGMLCASEIATQMRMASAYLHPSNYETFSVVCAEAITVGCPVIASSVGGIPEFINKDNGILIEKNNADSFYNAMHQFLDSPIQLKPTDNFSPTRVGIVYMNVLKSIVTPNETSA